VLIPAVTSSMAFVLTSQRITLLQNAEARGYYENKTKGDYIIKLKGPYDIAVNRQSDGTFGLTADLWNGHVEKEVGQGYGKLLQFYGVHKATIEARKKGLVGADVKVAVACLVAGRNCPTDPSGPPSGTPSTARSSKPQLRQVNDGV
jgi:hypothetical protein